MLCAEEPNAIDELLIETSPFRSGEKDLPVQPTKRSLSVKWLAAMWVVYWVAHIMPAKHVILSEEI